MKLQSVRLEQFRQFRQPLVINALDDGINLFTGPNEAGKSTIVAAIRAAFFERHRSGSVDDLRPWGDSAASPTVEIGFSIGGTAYRLTKSFLGKKRCELQAGAQRLDGALAEDHLAELLGFQYAGKGASAAQHWGIPGLLWIEQGAGHELREPVAHATDHLRNALNESLGEVASSSGDEVLAAVEAQRNELLTPAGGAPRGGYADVLKRLAQQAEVLRALDADVLAYREKVDQLATLRRDQAGDEAQKPWAALRAQEQAARDRLAAIEQVQASLAADRQRAEQLAAQVNLLRGQVEAFADQEAAAAARAAAVESARQAAAATDAVVEHWTGPAATAAANYETARERLRLARQAQTRADKARELAELRHKVEAGAVLLQQAQAEAERVLALQAQVAATAIDTGTLQRLRQQSLQRRELQIQRAAIATRLRFSLDGGRQMLLGDEALSGDGERLLLAPTTLQLPGWGRLEIAPGGDDLAELGRREAVLDDEQAATLQVLGLASLEAAEARHLTQLQKSAELQTARATLKALAPKGLDALTSEAQSQAARARDVEAALQPLQQSPRADAEAPLSTVSEAEAAEEATRRSLAQIGTSLGQARVAAGNALAALEAAQREHLNAQALLSTPDRAERLRAAQQALVDSRAEHAALAEAMRARTDTVALARPDILQQDVERFRNSADQLEQAFAKRKTDLLRIEVELEAAGAQGLEERRAEAARDLAPLQRRGDELRRRAAALDHLLRLLKARRGALTRRLQAPLQKHLNHYLQLLFPQAQLAIDENLSPGPLTRPGGAESGAFETLSFGAREQMGVISRLAYADLLREAGRPTLIILDDALVHSDEQRLAQMKRILFDAATRHQILLFTCHPEHWRDLGVRPRAIAELRGA